MNRLTYALLCVILGSSHAHSCSCGRPDDPATSRARADIVFRGRVKDVSDSYGLIRRLTDKGLRRDLSSLDPDRYCVEYGFRISFEVTDVWKGSVPKTVDIVTGRGGGDCGVQFIPGVTYLVYAYRDRHGNLNTNICTRTAEASKAGADLLALGPSTAPK